MGGGGQHRPTSRWSLAEDALAVRRKALSAFLTEHVRQMPRAKYLTPKSFGDNTQQCFWPNSFRTSS